MRTILTAAFLAAFFMPGVALAQMICGDSAEAFAYFEKKHGETPAAVGLTNDGKVVNLLRSPKDTWTLLLRFPDSRACVIARGKDWSHFIRRDLEPGAPS